MPLGGVGTGNLAICGDGSLRQWQLNNVVNHVAYLPNTFLAVRWQAHDTPAHARILQTAEFWDQSGFTPPETTSDHYVPPELITSFRDLPLCRSTEFSATYPIAHVAFDVGEMCPIGVELKAWSPLAPISTDASSWPVAVFDVCVRNDSREELHVALLATLQNPVGWDGRRRIESVFDEAFGGNINTPLLADGVRGVVLHNETLGERDPTNGQLGLATTANECEICTSWDDVQVLWAHWVDLARLPSPRWAEPTPNGRTTNAALSVAAPIEPECEARFQLLLAWQFPNRYVDWMQWEEVVPAELQRQFLGNAYCHRGALRDWLPEFASRLPQLERQTESYVQVFETSDAWLALLAAASSNVCNLRTNVCMRIEDGSFHGFEGGLGASTSWTGMFGTGGCCPMNCTHVWNYDQTLCDLWPELFCTMRDVDWKLNQHRQYGYIPHRTTLPKSAPRLWEVKIGGPDRPAIDGLFAAILKTLQYWHKTANDSWLIGAWPSVRSAMEGVMQREDSDGDGVLWGEQPNTYDIHLYGANTFVGSQYLAALLACAKIGSACGDTEFAERCRERFRKGSANYDEVCFNGTYYVQRVPPGCDAPYQYGEGCVSDQLLGQWWAHHLGLGYVLPRDHVRSALQAIFRHNFRAPIGDFEQKPRKFAEATDSGLLVATYLPGQRPREPLMYSDEVWTGVEYAYAALCLHEGLDAQARSVVSAVRARYDGSKRNPFNEVECGDHYVRALSAWSLLSAWSGLRYETPSRSLYCRPHPHRWPTTCPAMLGESWCRVSLNNAGHGAADDTMSVQVTCVSGKLAVERVIVVREDRVVPVPVQFEIHAGETHEMRLEG